jgi:hypothetical protein
MYFVYLLYFVNRLQTFYLSTSFISNESVAQLVEHNTFNVGVLGSNPSRFTKQVSLAKSCKAIRSISPAHVVKLVDTPS